MIRIDSHHHFWNYSSQEYAWISDQMQVLRRSFAPADLRAVMDASHVDAAVSVQARQSTEETDFLLACASEHEWIRGVVGWAPLADPALPALLERWRDWPLLKGLRHVVQDEPDPNFLDRSNFNAGVAQLGNGGLVYDILIFSKQLPMAIRFADRHPNLPMVLDHIAKPVIAGPDVDAAWEKDFRELAERPNVVCKFSALVTEVRDPEWTVASLRPYWNVALEAFGPDRLMFGSDWPVCLLRATYADWVAAVSVYAADLSASEQSRFWGENAARVYRLNSA